MNKPVLDFELTILALERYLEFQKSMAEMWRKCSEEAWLQNMEPVEIVEQLLEKYHETGDPIELVLSIKAMETIEIEAIFHFLADEGLIDEISQLFMED